MSVIETNNLPQSIERSTIDPRTLGVEIRIVEMDSSLAKWLLKHNMINRALRDKTVKQYARDMEAGKWSFTTQTISLSKNGDLLDGQHRLKAFLEAKSPKGIYFILVANLPREVQGFVDQGLKRSTKDALNMLDSSYDFNIYESAVITALGRIDKNHVWKNSDTSISEKSDIYKKYKGNFDTIVRSFSNNTKMEVGGNTIRGAVAAGLVYYAYHKNVPALDVLSFIVRVRDNDSLDKGSPEHKLHNYLVNDEEPCGSAKQEKDFYESVWAIHAYFTGIKNYRLVTKYKENIKKHIMLP